MKNQDRNHILLWLFAIAVALALNSCSAVKKDKTQTEEVIKTELAITEKAAKLEESNVKKTENTKVDDKNETITEETTYEPIDPSKPASIIEPDGRKTDLNNSKKTTREITQKNNTKIDNSKKSDEFHKSESSESSESDAKSNTKKAAEEINVDKKSWSIWNLFWLLIPIAIYLVWKNRTKIIGYLSGLY